MRYRCLGLALVLTLGACGDGEDTGGAGSGGAAGTAGAAEFTAGAERAQPEYPLDSEDRASAVAAAIRIHQASDGRERHLSIQEDPGCRDEHRETSLANRLRQRSGSRS